MTARYRPRELSGLVREALQSVPVVVVTGLRQAGKTTFLQQDPVFRGRRYLSLDDFATLEAARRQPEALLEGETPVTVDEAQRAPELLLTVKQLVDRNRSPGRFVLSGSANFALSKELSETLAGRALYLTLYPFTRREIQGRLSSQPQLVRMLQTLNPPKAGTTKTVAVGEEEILNGGMPPVVLEEAKNRSLWMLGYEQTYLERDIRQLSQVADLISFRTLLRLAANRTAQLLNQSELGRDAKLPASTVSRYLGLLETSFVLSRLPPYLRNHATRLIKSPKLFLADSGLAAHLAAVDDLAPETDEPLRGALYETYFHQNIASILAAHAPTAELGFWHVQGRHEVDFVIAYKRKTLAIELKASSRFHPNDLAGLRAFLAKSRGPSMGVLAYNGRETVPLDDKLFAIPIAVLVS